MNKDEWVRLIFIIVVSFALVITAGIVIESQQHVEPPLTTVQIEEPEQEWSVAVMEFTQDEADELLERLRIEREEKERKEAEAAARARAALIANATYTPSYFRNAGRIWWGGWSWTWYSERILPGYGLRIPGRHTDSLGYVRDGNGYLCLASDVHRKGTILETPFGSHGKVYDCGCGNNYTIDVYVGW